MGGMHNTRILRFLAVLGAVLVTIFIYASYSTNTSLTPPPHMRAASGNSGGAPSEAAYQQQLVLPLSSAAANAKKNNSIEERSINKLHASGGGGGNANSINTLQLDKTNRKTVAGMASNAKKQHREPTIDADADGGGAGGDIRTGGSAGAAGGASDDLAPEETDLDRFINNDVLEEQYVQNVDSVLSNANNTISVAAAGVVAGQLPLSQQASQQQDQTHETQEQQDVKQQEQLKQNLQLISNNLNKIPDSDVLIPTSNLQKFIENADKILKNITATPTAANNASDKDSAANKVDKQQEAQQEAQQEPQQKNESSLQKNVADKKNQIVADSDNDIALPPSVVMSIKRGESVVAAPDATKTKTIAVQSKTAAKQSITTVKAAVDPTQGIPTREIYESGHMNEDINIEQLCPKRGVDLRVLILITSAQDHGQSRLSIRQTWGHYGIRRDVSMAFILGRTTNESLNTVLSKENYIYGDLIRGNFIDSYNNLTLKTVSALEWADEHCPSAKYILKTDDDMFINVPRLLAFLDTHAKEKRVIFGRLAKKWKPIRNKKSKYYVSTGQFSAATFPPFTTGPAYVMSSDVIHDLYVRSLNEVYLKLEDVFTTGIVAQQLNIKRVHAYEFLNRRISFNACNLRKAISVHMIKANEQFDLWKKLLDQTTRCK